MSFLKHKKMVEINSGQNDNNYNDIYNTLHNNKYNYKCLYNQFKQ